MYPENDRDNPRYSTRSSSIPNQESEPRRDGEEQSARLSDDEYVDWNQRGRIIPQNRRNKSIAFGAPFLAVLIVFVLFDRLLDDKSPVKPVSPEEIATLALESGTKQPKPETSLRSAVESSVTPSATADASLTSPSIVEDAAKEEEPAPSDDAEILLPETPTIPDFDAPLANAADDDAPLDAPTTDDLAVQEIDASSLLSVADEHVDFEIPNDDLFDPEIPALSDELATQPLDEPEPEIDVEAARAELAQIEFLFRRLKDSDARSVDDTIVALDEPIAQTRIFLENAPEELKETTVALLKETEEFQKTLQNNVELYHRLDLLDQASRNAEETREFFASWQRERAASDTQINADAPSPGDAYDAEFALVAESLAALDVVEKWNAFMQENGERLERFHVSQQDAKLALAFLEELVGKPGVPEELRFLEKKQDQWRFEAEHDFPTQRKILLMLESEFRQKYWTYMPSRDKVYYLPAAPRVGENAYVASAQGSFSNVKIPAEAPELATKDSPQKSFLEELDQKARQIPDSLRNDDVAQWYARWSEFLKELQETKSLDPILQYKFIQGTVEYLQQSDYHFALRLDPLLRVLNAPQIDRQGAIDRFQTESESLVALRKLAISRVDFLPNDHLIVNKSTDELNANSDRFTTLYRRVGWLDKNFNGEWTLRRDKDVPLPEGDLYVVYAEAEGSVPRWFKIGAADGQTITLNVASDSIPRGSIVLCRIPLTQNSTVATRSAVDALFMR